MSNPSCTCYLVLQIVDAQKLSSMYLRLARNGCLFYDMNPPLDYFQEKYESECVNAKSEVQNLSGKVRNLESVLDEMHRAAENRREIERQHKEALVSRKL